MYDDRHRRCERRLGTLAACNLARGTGSRRLRGGPTMGLRQEKGRGAEGALSPGPLSRAPGEGSLISWSTREALADRGG